MRKLSKILFGAAVVLAAGSAQAATVTTTFQAKIIITAQCLVSATILDFGTSGVIAANIDQSSTITVTCTNTTPYNVGLDKGANGASVTTRLMKGGPSLETIAYSMWTNAGRTTNWGNTVGTDTLLAPATARHRH